MPQDGIPLEHLRDRNFVCRDLQLRKNNNKLRSPDERLSPMLGLAHMLVLPRAALRGEGVEARVQDAPDSAEELRQEEEQAIGMVKVCTGWGLRLTRAKAQVRWAALGGKGTAGWSRVHLVCSLQLTLRHVGPLDGRPWFLGGRVLTPLLLALVSLMRAVSLCPHRP